MNAIDNSKNEAKSITMDLENLQQKYSNLLIQYKQAVTDYVNYLNLETTNYKNYVSIKGMAYTGTGPAEQSAANTLQSCEAACSSSPKCSGATFVAGKCNLRVGDTPIISSSSDSYAIVPKGKQLLMNMEDLNLQLLNVNREITNKINIGQPVYYNVKYQNDEKSQELIKNYKELENERDNIRKLLEDYNTLDRTENENQIKITKNYYSYILFFILAGIVLFLLFKLSFPSASNTPTIQYGGDELNTNAYYIVFFIIILAISVNSIIYFSL